MELSALLHALLKSAEMERSCTLIAILSTSALITNGKPLTVHPETFTQIQTKVNEQIYYYIMRYFAAIMPISWLHEQKNPLGLENQNM